jgi:riboflavin kinase/FMN adenylyltransferase
MQVFYDPVEFLNPSKKKVSVAIGVFDGVHLGHQEVIRIALSAAAIENGMTGAITFDKHPGAVVRPDKAPKLIYSLPHRLSELSKLPLQFCWVIPFNETFSQQPAAEFAELLAKSFPPLRHISVGDNFTFGFKRSGNVENLKLLGLDLGFHVEGVSPVQLNGELISSTRIRSAIQRGDLKEAARLLGRPFSIRGPVQKGKQLATKIGFPTANLSVSGLALPPFGVYQCQVFLADKILKGVCNLGMRPTVEATSQPVLEVHILDFAEVIYGNEIDVVFGPKIRDEIKFQSVEQLSEQIRRDVAAASIQ